VDPFSLAKKERATFSPGWLSLGIAAQTDDEMFAALIAGGAITPSFAHPRSASMLPESSGGFVSAKLLVYGMSSLSVAHASIVLLIPATHL
jgi:hypothetical protein